MGGSIIKFGEGINEFGLKIGQEEWEEINEPTIDWMVKISVCQTVHKYCFIVYKPMSSCDWTIYGLSLLIIGGPHSSCSAFWTK